MIEPTLWPLLPVAVAIAILYTSTGISGANFWVPVYLLGLGLDPRVGFWLALVTMLFGSASGLVRHARQGTIDWAKAGRHLLFAVPAAVLGSVAAGRAPTVLLLALFGSFALFQGVSLPLRGRHARDREAPERAYLLALLGGLLTGLISVGVGVLLLPRFLQIRRAGGQARAVGTVLVVVFLASLAAALARLSPAFVRALEGNLGLVLSILVFVVPGVLLGGQLGPRLARRLPEPAMRRYAAALLLVVGLLLLFRAVTGA